MRRVYLYWFVLVLCLVPALRAQAPPAPAKPAVAVPALDDVDKAQILNVALAGQIANTACQGLEAVKQFVAVQKDVLASIEKRHPGFTLDLSKGTLVAKAAKE